MIVIGIVDDHAIVRAGLRALLADAGDVHIDFATGSSRDAVARCATTEVDVVLMDLRLGVGESGVDATAALRALPRPPQVLVVTNYDTDADILGAIEAGAAGYLLKDTPPADLIAAIRAAAQGDSALSPAIATRLLSRVRRPDPDTLTPREVDVLAQVADGLSNREIAKALFLSEMTVKSHLAHVYGKLGVRSRTAAVARARTMGLLG
ncbi:response regulator transcription factor [Gordonia sp. TBRC 11910]|uniref:Response regulator transcription factor n=1 Tax=Gordonia asplenii TaxID=2725283 RepID=A0A848KR84_9ACTN|nr:response regulator transcription factor [Gordonia asplenii]NMO00900.1 response regulator transcription factor [Gordonia asplenii]